MLVDRTDELAAIETVLARGGVLLFEARAGIGKTSLLRAASERGSARGFEVLWAGGSELETGFPFGVVRQLFERRLLRAGPAERDTLLRGPAAGAEQLLLSGTPGPSWSDASFAVLHALYWLVVNLTERRPLAVVVDDVHWADEPSLRWLGHLSSRMEGLPVALIVATRLVEAGSEIAAMSAMRSRATVLHPGPLSEESVRTIVCSTLGAAAIDDWSAALHRVTGGNPFYIAELLRGVDPAGDTLGGLDEFELLAGGGEGITRRLVGRIRQLDPEALALAQCLAVLGDGCQLRHGAGLLGIDVERAVTLGAGLVRVDVLAAMDPTRFLHPVVRAAVEASLPADRRHVAHRGAAQLLFAERAAPGLVAAHLARTHPAGDVWVVSRLREAAWAAMAAGSASAAAGMLRRALAEPPEAGVRVDVLRELARAEATAGHQTAFHWLEEALSLTRGARARAEIALEMAETYAGLFRWVDAVDVTETALAELLDVDTPLADRLRAQLVVAGLHDARCASRVLPVLGELAGRQPTRTPAGDLAVATGMAKVLAGSPLKESADVLEAAVADPLTVKNWDSRAALMWSLVTVERFDVVAAALESMLTEVRQSGSARGLVAVYSSLGLLHLRLGSLPEADVAARVAFRVLQEGDFSPGLVFGASLLAEVAIEAGEFDEAETALGTVDEDNLVPGVGTVLIPAAYGRLHLAAGRPQDALREFERCAAMFSTEVWGLELRDVGYLHARSGAAEALWRLGRRDEAMALADAELSDVRRFGGARAIGVASRIAGVVTGGSRELDLLAESVEALRASPAVLERAKSLAALGAALRRRGQRSAAREPLGEALELAARCGARPLAARARQELHATGSRPRREWRRGVESLTPSELRVAHLATQGKTNRQIAQELYVTLKTIEGHLAHVYAKLAISGRAELAQALTGENSRVATR